MVLGTGSTSVAQADAVTDWHFIATDTLCTASAPTRGPSATLDLAIVQAAVFDAVQAINGKYKPYQVQIAGAAGSPEAATAAAAHGTLVALFPTRKGILDLLYKGYLAQKGLKEDDPGVAVGQKAAAGMIAFRADDGRAPSPMPVAFMGETKIAMWRASAPTGMASSWMGTTKPFVIQSGSQFRAPPPPALTSEEYARDYNETKMVGAKNSSTRTPEQTELAQFYHSAYFCKTVQSGLNSAVEANAKDINESSRAIALANLAISDALITVWDTKRHYGLWRPSTAIKEGENDGNPATAGDPNWEAFLPDPAYSDYTSGANGYVGAMMRTLANVFGKDDIAFTVTSESPGAKQKTRSYSKCSEMVDDMVNVRIYQGIHFRFADVAGRDQGMKVADEVFKKVGTPK